MDIINAIFVVPLGMLMKFCYNLLGNYGCAIILFTLFTKMILLPLSVWVHKNSIKMVEMQPEINRIKVKFFGDKDKIADEESLLHKKHKYNPFASIIPLAVQVALLMIVVEVIYNPLTYILDVPRELRNEAVSVTASLTDIDAQSSSAQLAVVQAVQNDAFADSFSALQNSLPEINVSENIGKIKALDMQFAGFDLSWITVNVWGISVLVPVIAGISAWLLCFLQNKANVLQSEQGKLNKYSTTVLSVGLSLYLGLLVPAGVALYWVASNVFAIIQMYALNAAIKPSKYVDYEALEESRKELAAIESVGDKKKMFSKDINLRREREDYKKFFKVANKHLVFYSEKSGFYKYFRAIIEYLLEHTNITVHYVTSDPNDQIFKIAESNPKIRPYYIGQKRLITLFMKMDAEIVVMTTPDLDNFYLKRSYVKKDVEYIYIEHGIGSSNFTTNKGCYDHYDTMLCVGQFYMDEIRETEEMYSLPPKKLIPCGYGVFDDMIANCDSNAENDPKIILIAPSWGVDNILDSCIYPMLESLLKSDYKIIVRPHPEYIKRYGARLDKLMTDFADKVSERFMFETDFSSNSTVFSADVLITDWSGIATEYSFSTKRPCLFVDTTMRIMNDDYYKYKNQPIEITLRDKIGVSIKPGEADKTLEKVSEMIERRDEYTERISDIVGKYVFNIGGSGKAGAKYIISSLQEKAAAADKKS